MSESDTNIQMKGEASRDGATMQIYKTAKRARLAAEAAAEKLEREQRERRRGEQLR